MPNLLLDIGANIAKLQQEVAHAQKTMTGFARSAENAFKSIGSIAAATGITYGMQQSVKSFMDAESASMKLALAMKNQGEYSKAAKDDLSAYADQIQELTGQDNDLVISLMASMKTFGLQNEELKRATKAVMDWSAQTGKSHEDAAQIIGKASMGITTGLKRIGIVVDENTPKAGVLNKVLTQLENRFGGAAQANLETYAGQWLKIKTEFGNVGEEVGHVLLKALEGAAFVANMVAVGFYSIIVGALKMKQTLQTSITDPVNDFISKFPEKMDAQIGKISPSFLKMVQSIREATKNPVAEKAFEGFKVDKTAANETISTFEDLKRRALENADSTWKMLDSWDSIDKAMAKMKSGKPLKLFGDDDVKAALANLKLQYETAKELTRDFYKAQEEEIRTNEQIMKIMGVSESQITEEVSRAKETAINDYYQKETELIKLAAAERTKEDKTKVSDAVFIAEKIKALDSEVAMKRVSLANETKISLTKIAYDELQVQADVYNKQTEELQKATEKWSDINLAGAEKYKQMVSDESEFAQTENERAINKIIADEKQKQDELLKLYQTTSLSYEDYQRLRTQIADNAATARSEKEIEGAKKIADLNYNLIKDIQGYETIAFNKRIEQINAQAAVDKKAGGDKAAINTRVAHETNLAFIAMGRSGGNFIDGVTAGYLEMQKSTVTFGKAGYDIFKSFSESSYRTVSDVLFDSIKGDMKSLSDYWESWSNSILRTFTDTVAQMAVQWAMAQTMKAGAAAGDWLWDLLITGYGGGAWEIQKDKWTKVHAGEMIVPAAQAEIVRKANPQAGEGFAPTFDWAGLTGYPGKDPGFGAMSWASYMEGQAVLGAAKDVGRISIMSGLLGLMTGMPIGKLAEIALGPTVAKRGMITMIKNMLNWGDQTKANQFASKYYEAMTMPSAKEYPFSFGELGPKGFQTGAIFGGAEMPSFGTKQDLQSFMDSISGATGYEGTGWGGESYSGFEDEDYGEGGRKGGIFRGPKSGYLTKMHGTEAVVPLPDGKSIPVEMNNPPDAGVNITINANVITTGDVDTWLADRLRKLKDFGIGQEYQTVTVGAKGIL